MKRKKNLIRGTAHPAHPTVGAEEKDRRVEIQT